MLEEKKTIDKEIAQDNIIWSNNLSKNFGDEQAVENLNLSIPKGSIFGFIGPSGCGKTTTVRLLTGIYQPDSGEARVKGKKPSEFNLRDRERIGYLLQQFVLYPDLTVWENLNFAASLYGVSSHRRKRINALLKFVELDQFKKKLAKNLSGGMRRRLSLASTLVHDPEILFLDEPTAGIDPILRREFWDYFKDLQNEGRTLFITTQYVGEAAYCDLVGIMMSGRLLQVDTPAGLRRKAFGGDVILLRTVHEITQNQAKIIENNLEEIQASIFERNNRDMRILVQDAASAMLVLIQYCHDQNIEIEAIEEYSPPFDEVFVKLIEENGNNA